MPEKDSAYEETYQEYMAEIAKIDFASKLEILGATMEGEAVVVPFFDVIYRITPKGILDPDGNKPHHSINITLCKYLLMCPTFVSTDDQWVTYKDIPDAAPFVGAFAKNAEIPLAQNFAGKAKELKKAGLALGGAIPDLDLPYQVVLRFEALPRVPALLLFNDADEEFPAQCSLLFERRVETFIDMECLAVVGWYLADNLKP